MMTLIKKWLGRPTVERDNSREQRSMQLDAMIQDKRRDLRRDRVVTRLEARSSARYYNALTDAMTMLREQR